MAFRVALVFVFPVIGIALRETDVMPLNWALILGSGVIGWFFPVLWMNSRIARRQRTILKSMPFIVDLLAPIDRGWSRLRPGAIGKVVEKANPSPLVEEFGQLLKEIKVGASRQEALREMSLRIRHEPAQLVRRDPDLGRPDGRLDRQQGPPP